MNLDSALQAIVNGACTLAGALTLRWILKLIKRHGPTTWKRTLEIIDRYYYPAVIAGLLLFPIVMAFTFLVKSGNQNPATIGDIYMIGLISLLSSCELALGFVLIMRYADELKAKHAPKIDPSA